MTEIIPPTVVRLLPKVPAQKFRFGYPWVFVDELVMDRRTRNTPAGSIVKLQDGNRQDIGLCMFNGDSKIICRILDRNCDAVIDRAWIKGKLQTAFELRDKLYDAPFYRLVHAEADGLPGVIIDRFGDVAVIQPNVAWAENQINDIAAALIDVTGVETVVKNGSGRSRKLEGLPEENTVIAGKISAPVPVQMNGATYLADVLGGQKTGLFFDQAPNHAFAARLAKDARVLDVFCHVGGFGLAALAAGAKSALGVDGSAASLELAELGAAAGGTGDKFSTLRGDAFEVMASLHDEGNKFDLVVCDPPAFAPNKNALEAGLRAYQRVARRGAELTEKGGYLVLCSCSHAASFDKFRDTSLAGIGKAGRQAQLLHSGAAGPDHPTHPQLTESGYLKALFFRLD